ncbi:hypothetical protein AB0C34_16895 [Nocardia sp. NPDC049220]|uniref:hypothetical protein n=1 Tax=Nocardia sp. NPDC049220 TaxID=3155273 RepID=UPI0033D162A5
MLYVIDCHKTSGHFGRYPATLARLAATLGSRITGRCLDVQTRAMYLADKGKPMTEKCVRVQPRFGGPGAVTVTVPRGGRFRLTTDTSGARWLIVRNWYGRVVRRMPVAGLW